MTTITASKPVTLDELADAIAYKMSEQSNDLERNEKISKELAFYVLSFFGFSNQVIDNYVGEDRVLFYRLEDWGIIRSDTEECYRFYNQRPWRIFYFVLQPEQIRRFSKLYADKKSVGITNSDVEGEVYKNEEIWRGVRKEIEEH